MGGPGSGRKKGSINKNKKTTYTQIAKGAPYKNGQVGLSKRATGTSKQGRGYRYDILNTSGKRYLGVSPATKWHFNLKGKKPLKLSRKDPYFISKAAKNYYTE